MGSLSEQEEGRNSSLGPIIVETQRPGPQVALAGQLVRASPPSDSQTISSLFSGNSITFPAQTCGTLLREISQICLHPEK